LVAVPRLIMLGMHNLGNTSSKMRPSILIIGTKCCNWCAFLLTVVLPAGILVLS